MIKKVVKKKKNTTKYFYEKLGWLSIDCEKNSHLQTCLKGLTPVGEIIMKITRKEEYYLFEQFYKIPKEGYAIDEEIVSEKITRDKAAKIMYQSKLIWA